MSYRGQSSATPGIQSLLAAEKAAAEQVKAARARKLNRLKQAKDEADAEVKAFKEQKEAEFKRRAEQNAGASHSATEQIKTDTARKLNELNNSVRANRGAVIDTLLDIVCQVKPQLHQNYKP